MVYICPGGDCTGIAIFFIDKVSHLKHPNGHLHLHKPNAYAINKKIRMAKSILYPWLDIFQSQKECFCANYGLKTP